MKSTKTILLILALLLSAVAFAYPSAAAPDQPFMKAAREDLQKARGQLQVAEHNKGGHRANAIEYVNAAIAEVNRGIAFDRRHNHAQSVTDIFAESSVVPDQPHMRSALEHLLNAKRNLDSATADKGGHRAKAIEFVNKAIEEVRQGIAAGA
jgi:hypothetical protein